MNSYVAKAMFNLQCSMFNVQYSTLDSHFTSADLPVQLTWSIGPVRGRRERRPSPVFPVSSPSPLPNSIVKKHYTLYGTARHSPTFHILLWSPYFFFGDIHFLYVFVFCMSDEWWWMMSRPCFSLSLCLPCYFNYKYYGAVNRTSSVTIFGWWAMITRTVVDILKDYVGACIVSIL